MEDSRNIWAFLMRRRLSDLFAGCHPKLFCCPRDPLTEPTAKDKEFSELMVFIWTQFAKSGNPNGKHLPQRDAYSVDNESYMELRVDTGQKSQLRLGEMALIEKAWRDRRAGGAVEGSL